jgi:hypothetical protein
MVSKKVRELFGPKFTFAKPDPQLVKLAILTLHAQVKAQREAEGAKGKPTLRRRGEEPSPN